MYKSLPPINLQIGKNLTAIRKQHGSTQIELAKKLGISQQTLSQYERGKRHLTAEMIIKIAHVLSTNTDDLIGLKTASVSEKALSLKIVKRMNEIEKLNPPNQKTLLKTIDIYLEGVRTKLTVDKGND